jgi:hypothetical protein
VRGPTTVAALDSGLGRFPRPWGGELGEFESHQDWFIGFTLHFTKALLTWRVISPSDVGGGVGGVAERVGEME